MSSFDPTIGRRTATDKREHVRFTRDFYLKSEKLAHLSDPIERAVARDLLATSIALTDEQGGDGHVIPEEVLARTGVPEEIAKVLILDGFWHQADHDCPRCPQPRVGHVYVHDFLEHNQTAEQKTRRRETARKAGTVGAGNRWAGHVRPEEGPKRPPGRPRIKTPLADQQLELVEVDVLQHAAVLNHPAEDRARSRRGRPRRTEPRIFEPWTHELAELLADGIARNDPNGRRPNVTQTWLNTFRLAHELDERPIEMMRKAVEWSQKHHFYSTIIKSPANFRKHYAAMHTRAIEEHNKMMKASAPRTAPPAAVTVPNMNSAYGVPASLTSVGGPR